MTAFSNYLERRLLEHTLAATPYPPPVTLFLSLHTADPGEDAALNEVSGGGYRRALATFTVEETAPGSGVWVASVANTIAYTNMPGLTVTHLAIHDAISSPASNPLYYGALIQPVAVSQGGTFVINTGGLTVTLS